MFRVIVGCIAALIAGVAAAQDDAPEVTAEIAAEEATEVTTEAAAPAERPAPGAAGVQTMSGMSILGNQEAPMSLVIVPWKASELGDGIGLGSHLDDRGRPIDKDVFMRELAYYEIRSNE